MSLTLLDGKSLSQKIMQDIKKQTSDFLKLSRVKPCLAVIIVGNDPSSHVYVNKKKMDAHYVGFDFCEYAFSENVSQEQLVHLIVELNKNPKIHGILIQLPLPSHLDSHYLIQLVDPNKDVDGFHFLNVGRLALGRPSFVPCTPLGICELLQYFKISISGQHVVILGRSPVVGRPMSFLLMQNKVTANATVTVCHSYTRDLYQFISCADIIIVAIGKPLFLNESFFDPQKKSQSVVIDVGIHRVKDSSSHKGYRLVGDVDFDAVKPFCKAITPVPGGVGPMTVAMLLRNTLSSAQAYCNS